MIRQASRAIQHQRNLDHLTQARQTQVYVNSHRKEDAPVFDDVALFLPHPAAWKTQNMNRTLNISRPTAIAVIQSMEWLDSNVLAALDPWLAEIELIAQGE